MKIEKICLNKDRNVTLTAYIQDVGGEFANIIKRPAILILPGGGYSMCSDREAEPVAFEYLKAGYHAFVLRYSVKEFATWPNPLNDFDQAMDLIKSKAKEWNIYDDKIATVGFSAGGHLAASAATSARNKPAAAILGYPAILDDIAKACHPTIPGVAKLVDSNTAPCFVFTTRTDRVVAVRNSLEFLLSLEEHGISFESHIYSYGPHGFSTGASWVQDKETTMTDRIHDWVDDSIGWLKEILGDFGHRTMTQPKCGKKVDGNGEEYLSIDCTLGHLMEKESITDIMNPILETIRKIIPSMANFGKEGEENTLFNNIIRHHTLTEVLEMLQIPKEEIEKINEALNKNKNQ